MKASPLAILLLSFAAAPLACKAQRVVVEPPSDAIRVASMAESNAKRKAGLAAIGKGPQLAALKAALKTASYGSTIQEQLREERDDLLVYKFVQAGYSLREVAGLDRLGYGLMDVFSGNRSDITETHARAFNAEMIVVATVVRRYYEDRNDGLRTSVVLRIDEPYLPMREEEHLVLRLFSGTNPDGSSAHRSSDPDLIIGEQYLMGLSRTFYSLARHYTTGDSGPHSSELVAIQGLSPALLRDADPEIIQTYREVAALRKQARGGR